MNWKLHIDWRHWLFGVNWAKDPFSEHSFVAVHFGPIYWIRSHCEERIIDAPASPRER